MEGGRPVPGLALEVAHGDLDASTQRMESVEPCRLGLWAIGELEKRLLRFFMLIMALVIYGH